MMISRGQRLKLADCSSNTASFSINVAIDSPNIVIDFSIFGVDAASKLSDDRYIVFYNQPNTPCGAVKLRSDQTPSQATFDFALSGLPPSIQRLVIAASIDGSGTMGQMKGGHLRFVAGSTQTALFPLDQKDYAKERVLILGEI
jgi:stress response protein SCP2